MKPSRILSPAGIVAVIMFGLTLGGARSASAGQSVQDKIERCTSIANEQSSTFEREEGYRKCLASYIKQGMTVTQCGHIADMMSEGNDQDELRSFCVKIPGMTMEECLSQANQFTSGSGLGDELRHHCSKLPQR